MFLNPKAIANNAWNLVICPAQLHFVFSLTMTCAKLTSIGKRTGNSKPSKDTERKFWKHGVCVYCMVPYFLGVYLITVVYSSKGDLAVYIRDRITVLDLPAGVFPITPGLEIMTTAVESDIVGKLIVVLVYRPQYVDLNEMYWTLEHHIQVDNTTHSWCWLPSYHSLGFQWRSIENINRRTHSTDLPWTSSTQI